MSRDETRMSDGSRARSRYWVMTVMMVGLAGCPSPRPRPSPDGDADARVSRRHLDVDPSDPYRCQDGGPDKSLYELDAARDGGVGANAACVDPDGGVMFKSDCDTGTVTFTFPAPPDGSVFSNDRTVCTPSDAGSVTIDGGTYTITLPNLGDACQLGIAPNARGSFTWTARSACHPPNSEPAIRDVGPITGTVEVATTIDPSEERGDAGRR